MPDENDDDLAEKAEKYANELEKEEACKLYEDMQRIIQEKLHEENEAVQKSNTDQ